MIFAALFLLLPAPALPATSLLLGEWTTPDHSVVRVFHCADSRLCARIIGIGPKTGTKVDVNNPVASDRQRSLCGLIIGSDFQSDGAGHAKQGHIYDPESGKTYAAEMSADGDVLKLRGYVGISLFGRNETWHRTQGVLSPCT